LDKKHKYSPLIRFTGLASQMVGALVLGIWVGQKLDAYFGNSTPLATLTAMFVALSAVFWLIYKDLKKME